MNALRGWIVFAWIALPTVMYGGYSLLRLINQRDALSEFRLTWFRAGHAHAGVLLLMSLLYFMFMDRTSLPTPLKHAASATLVVGILAQSGGFFIHMVIGEPHHASVGSVVTASGALLLVIAVAVLAYGLIARPIKL